MATALLDEAGTAWVNAIKLGRFTLYCNCGIHGVFDTREELLASNEYDSAKHSDCKHDLAIRKITDKNIQFLKGIALCDVAPEALFDCYSELYQAFEAFANGKVSEEETLQKFKEIGY